MGRKKENQNPTRIWEQEHFSTGIMAALSADPGRAVPQVPLCQTRSGGTFLRSESRVFSN